MTIVTTGWLLMVAAVLTLNVVGWVRRGFRRDRRSRQGTSSSVDTGWWTYSDGPSWGSSDGSSCSSSDSGSSSSDCWSRW